MKFFSNRWSRTPMWRSSAEQPFFSGEYICSRVARQSLQPRLPLVPVSAYPWQFRLRVSTRSVAVKIALLSVLGWIACLFLSTQPLHAAELPQVQMVNGSGQLIVNGHPFLILGGELGNSSSTTAAQADAILPKLAAMHVNTVLMPVGWEQLEPKEGSFDFGILDHWIETARAHKIHLVLLWFGSWKNAFSNYAPSWVKSDPKRFPRAESADGRPLEILSTLSPEARRCDARA